MTRLSRTGRGAVIALVLALLTAAPAVATPPSSRIYFNTDRWANTGPNLTSEAAPTWK